MMGAGRAGAGTAGAGTSGPGMALGDSYEESTNGGDG